MIENQAMGNINGVQEISIKDTFLKIIVTDKEQCTGMMVHHIKVNGNKAYRREEEYFFQQKDKSLKVFFETIN